MASSFEKLHPLVLIPVLLFLWVFGGTILILFLSAANAPGLNEHGTGLLLAVAAELAAVIAALVHALVVIRNRRSKVSK